jgi:periplasmic divalent cation tolerance protein
MEHIVVFITAPGEEEAAKISHALVEARLAGCANIVKGIRSIYRWQGKVEDEGEVLKKVKELHPYTVPEVIAFPIIEGSADYLNWLGEVTG